MLLEPCRWTNANDRSSLVVFKALKQMDSIVACLVYSKRRAFACSAGGKFKARDCILFTTVAFLLLLDRPLEQ